VCEGTPEHVAKVEDSWTGRFLAPLLEAQTPK
jgi:excinuclease UvrABC ATPase subunit